MDVSLFLVMVAIVVDAEEVLDLLREVTVAIGILVR